MTALATAPATDIIDVSFVIPARNEEGYVGAALRSIAEQVPSGPAVEAIVVSNASHDGTAGVVRTFASQRPDVPTRLLEDAVPGAARARNRGAAVARGRVLVFLDADSRAAPDLAGCVWRNVERGVAPGCIPVLGDSSDLLDRLFFDMIEFGKRWFRIRAQMFYCTREVFEATDGFDETLILAEDREFLLRLRRAGINVTRLDDSWIATSPRRLHSAPCRLGMAIMLGRWALAGMRVGRRWMY